MLKEKARMIARVVYVADLALTTAAFFAAFFIRDLILPKLAPDQFPTGLFPLHEYIKIYPVVLILWSILLFTYHSYHSHRTVPLLREALTAIRVVFVGNAILATIAYLLPLLYFDNIARYVRAGGKRIRTARTTETLFRAPDPAPPGGLHSAGRRTRGERYAQSPTVLAIACRCGAAETTLLAHRAHRHRSPFRRKWDREFESGLLQR